MSFTTLNELKQKNCLNFIENLCVLEDHLGTEDFTNSLANLHHAFLVLCNSFEIDSTKQADFLKNENDFGITEIFLSPLTLKSYNGIVIDIDESHSELASLFVGESEEKAIEKAQLFCDYETRCCDFCGLYLHKPDFSAPICRKPLADFTLAFHPRCYKEF